jgi:hypothetical protein
LRPGFFFALEFPAPDAGGLRGGQLVSLCPIGLKAGKIWLGRRRVELVRVAGAVLQNVKRSHRRRF